MTVLAAGVLGFSIICMVSAAALANPATPARSEIEPRDVVDSAFAKPINTAVAMTVVEMSEYIVSLTPSMAVTASPTGNFLGTPTLKAYITWTALPPTKSRDDRPVSTATNIPPTSTRVLPTATKFIPTSTHTDIPNTDTPKPPPTDTPVPPTDTPSVPTPPPDIPSDTPVPPTTEPPTVPPPTIDPGITPVPLDSTPTP
ncbi:MAG: hypothetical protein ACM3XO_04825 [Bacteroidota bacterium]